MKIKRVLADSKMRRFMIEANSRLLVFPYSQLSHKPSRDDQLVAIEVDAEIGGQGFTYRLSSGAEDTVLLDQVLDYNRDPEHLRKKILYDLTLEAHATLKRQKIAKREIARRLGTSPTALYRLLDQTYTKKSIDQMIKLINALGGDVSIQVKNVA